MRGYDIVVIKVDVFIYIMLEKIYLLVVEADEYFTVSAYCGGERAEEHMLVCAQLVKQHQYLGLPSRFFRGDIEALALDCLYRPLVPED